MGLVALDVIELILAAAFILFILFQITIPLIRGTPILPIFRKDKVRAAQEVFKAEELLQIAQLKKLAEQYTKLTVETRATSSPRNPPKEEPSGNAKPDAGPPSPSPN